MPRQRAKVDANQTEIIKALRAVGASVAPTHQVGKGFPDLVVGYKGRNILMEIKDGNKPPSQRKLTPDEVDWHDKWRGRVVIVNNVKEALDFLKH